MAMCVVRTRAPHLQPQPPTPLRLRVNIVVMVVVIVESVRTLI